MARMELPTEPTLSNRQTDAGSAPAALAGASQQQPGSRRFEAGQLVAGRFRIERFLAEGAMGEVYEAHDTELGERVALKTVRPEIAADPRVMERFRREVRLARKVTHPNVCRLYDVFNHQQPGQPLVLLLAMELLEGETLAEKLQRQGRLGQEQVLELARQMCAALAAAHAAGIVHRDFKSSNVMLVAASGERRAASSEPVQEAPLAAAVRVVITDFGLARSEQSVPGEALRSLTAEGAFVGTPAYMAPEQVEGEPVSPATDLYALGIVLYEMVTGSRPFVGPTPMKIAVQRLKQPPPSPRSAVPELSQRWDSAILKCLQRDPAARFTSARELLLALELPGSPEPAWPPPGLDETPALPPPSLQPGRPRWRFRPVIAGILLLLGGLALERAGLLEDLHSGPVQGGALQSVALPARAPESARRSVAMLGLRNLSGLDGVAWLSTALAEMLGAELASTGKLRRIPGEEVSRMLKDLGLTEQQSYGPETLRRIRQNLGADLVVVGSYLQTSGQLRVDLEVQDTVLAETVAQLSQSASEQQLLELVASAGGQLRGKLGLSGPASAVPDSPADSFPTDPGAARLYAQGLDALRALDALGALKLLEQAIAIEPDHPLLHSAMAEVWTRLGHDARARQEAGRAFELSARLPAEQQRLAEARYRELGHEWRQAIELYQALCRIYPDQPEYGLALARAQTLAGRGKDALATLDTLRAHPSGAAGDARIDLAEARAAESLSDYQRQLQAAERAAQQAMTQGAKLLVAESWMAKQSAFGRLGQYEARRAACSAARQTFAEAGDQHAVARVLSDCAATLQRTPSEVLKLYDQALSAFRQSGDRRSEAVTLRRKAGVLVQELQLTQADSHYREAAALFREIDDREGLAWTLKMHAYLLLIRGDLVGAKKSFDEQLAAFRDVGFKVGQEYALVGQGRVLMLQGHLEEAQARTAEALAMARENSDTPVVTEALNDLGTLLAHQGALDQAWARFDEARLLSLEKSPMSLAIALVNLARIRFLSGQAAEASSLCEQALAIVPELNNALGPDAWILATVGEVLLGQGRLDEPRKLLEARLPLWRKSEARINMGWALGFLAQIWLVQDRLQAAHDAVSEALVLAQASGQVRDAERHRLTLAAVLLEQANAEQAQLQASQAAEAFRARRLDADEALALATLARCARVSRRLDDAARALERARQLSQQGPNLLVRLSVALEAALLQAAQGDVPGTIPVLQDLDAQSRQAGYHHLGLEVRLALGQQLLAAGQSPAGRSTLGALQLQAATEGYTLIARKAASALD